MLYDNLSREDQLSLDEKILKVVKEVTPSTCMVQGAVMNPTTGRPIIVTGSGVVITADEGKFILTNAHVTQATGMRFIPAMDASYNVRMYNGEANAGVRFQSAPVVLSTGQRAHSAPPIHDLALLGIPPDIDAPSGVSIAHSVPEVGETVVAMGNPYGNVDNVSSGIVSHNDRKIGDNNFLGTTAEINPGNSGGGLFNLNAELVGINARTILQADGMGYAIRGDVIKAQLEEWGIGRNLTTSVIL